jgi:hypothetical protein
MRRRILFGSSERCDEAQPVERKEINYYWMAVHCLSEKNTQKAHFSESLVQMNILYSYLNLHILILQLYGQPS